MIQESHIHLFLINRLVNHSIFQNIIFLRTFDSECSYIEMWFTDRNSKPLETVDEININLVID